MTAAMTPCGVRTATFADRLTQTAQGCNWAEPAEIWKARNFIHEHSDEKLSLTQVAKVVNISAGHLSEKFKEVTGMNFVDYVAHTRFEKARGLLHDVDLRVTEIAFAVGFQSLSQFNRVFKQLSGQSPTQYRAALKGVERDERINTRRNSCRTNAQPAKWRSNPM